MANNQVEGTFLALLNWLSNQQAPEPEANMMKDVPIIVEEAEVEEGAAEDLVL